MSLLLERGDLLQLDPISNRGTLKLFPLGKKNKQKLIVGDDSGNVYCYEFKKGEPQVVFQAKPFEGAITCLTLGGNTAKRDKIFVAHGQSIRGMNKKGKDFFKMTSSLTETIQNIAVEDTRIWTGCECIYNLYDDGKDIALFASKDQIHDLLAAHLTRTSDFDTILACQDNCIRVVHGSQLFLEIPTSSAVMSLAMMEIEGGSGSGINTVTTTSTTSTTFASRSSMLVYGMSNGSLGLVQVFSNGTFNMAWTIEDVKRSPVTCLKVFDINRNGVPEVIVGRDDGRIEVFRFPSADTILSEPSKIFSKDIGESIRSVECGAVNTPEYNEILVASYSGKIISFTTEPIHVRATDDNYGRSIQTINNENRIKYMRKELEEMRKRVEKEREKVKKISLMGHANTTMMKPVQDFSVISSFKLDADLAAYVLSIELQTSIDLVVIRSPVALDLVETDSGTSVLSVTPPDLQPMHAGEELAGRFVAVFRCQSQHEKRIVLTLRTNEGEHGDMTVTIVAACVPKAAKIIKYNLKPLSLNSRIHQIDSVDLRRPRNRVKYSGAVPMSTIHEWVQGIFPDVPPHLDEKTSEQVYYFKNSFTGAVSLCEFRKNEIVFESESASTVAIAKENVTRMANYRRIQLEETVSAEDSSVASFLSLIRPKLEHQLSLTRKMQLVDAVQEIAMQEGELSWMGEEYATILREQETIRREFKTRDKSLEFLSGIVTDLFVDWAKLQGVDAKHKLRQLAEILMTGDFDRVVDMFLTTASASASRRK